MVLRGDLEKPENFLVLNADPGMENSNTYRYTQMMFERCQGAGIRAFTAEGPNLYRDLVGLKGSRASRIDNPPYWTRSEKGKRGRLLQKCTKRYKIDPMDRAIRQVLEEDFKISRKSKRLGVGVVEKWIGFSFDEVYRMKDSKQKYIRFEYPLIDLRMNKSDVVQYFQDNDLPIPPRSVCNACFANGLNTFRDMHKNRPADWKQAVEVDRAVRDLSQIMVKDEVYVSSTLIPLEDLASNDFELPDKEDSDNYSCDSGYCFT